MRMGFYYYYLGIIRGIFCARGGENEGRGRGGGGEPASVDCVATPSLQETGSRIAGDLLAGLLARKRAAWEFSVSGKGCC